MVIVQGLTLKITIKRHKEQRHSGGTDHPLNFSWGCRSSTPSTPGSQGRASAWDWGETESDLFEVLLMILFITMLSVNI